MRRPSWLRVLSSWLLPPCDFSNIACQTLNKFHILPIMTIPEGLSESEKAAYWKQYRKDWVSKNREKTREANRRWRENHPDKAAELAKKYRDKDPERTKEYRKREYEKNKARYQAYAKTYRTVNREMVNAKNLEYAKANRDKMRQWARESYQRHKEKAAARAKARREKIKALQQGLSRGLVTRLIVSQKGLCAKCACDLSVSGHHLDHIMALANGGQHVDENIQLLCPTCNKSKGSK